MGWHDNPYLLLFSGLLIYFKMLSQLRLNPWIFVNYEQGKMWNEAAEPYFKADLLPKHFPGKTEEIRENPQGSFF
jgi:hypothetical protein